MQQPNVSRETHAKGYALRKECPFFSIGDDSHEAPVCKQSFTSWKACHRLGFETIFFVHQCTLKQNVSEVNVLLAVMTVVAASQRLICNLVSEFPQWDSDWSRLIITVRCKMLLVKTQSQRTVRLQRLSRAKYCNLCAGYLQKTAAPRRKISLRAHLLSSTPQYEMEGRRAGAVRDQNHTMLPFSVG
ncbi:hypothetical protein BDU57DRAFT_79132 [Ampelomyces quisqualis]|uniref:Uncharacterized protein n=1 Tax=Ampelomyces quisqualis TaxID=50730 RepID=A0A6A5Q8X4_AMPQU|nr:hypothetical protein BDU57DRAFT_79132 [Ampelomyces quisqualis]